ncbi:Outer membrane protein assembly factor BamB precursor [Pirellulimonas nuda]|uniref:Outer membrane protein assembly factor BamB n=1 Tax=Pirellulimonas nuda TaxID=2528009 RepID=A0A518DEI0_9BACT|nr:PQQ-binding-like beta-propeller repeat protein [Pirellulimonas nuda]QDU89842.1 Outer membrane protein assembly factor BamB precursor [Pirellulimonas nuda]
MMLRQAVTWCALVAVVLGTASASADTGADAGWPQWRGPLRDGRALGDVWPESLGEDHLKQRWRAELGPSYSGPIVVGNRVFTTETRDEKTEVTSAFDLTTGERLWETQWPGAMKVPFFAASNGSWIRATPAADDDALYVVGIRDVLVALDQQSGAERWRIDFPKDFGSEPPAFGAASSPIVTEQFLYAQMGGGLAKIDKKTGEVLWNVARSGPGMASSGAFSSPYLAEVGGRTCLVVQTRQELKGVDPESGEVRWSQPIDAFQGMNILTPVVYRDSLFTSAHTGRSQMWRLSDEDPGQIEELWQNKSQAYMSSPVVVGGYLYMHLRNQRLQCLDLATGEEKWRTKPFGKYQSLVVLGDRILALDARGELILFRATPEAFEQIDARKVSDEETWAHLAVCQGVVIVRELNALAVYDWK